MEANKAPRSTVALVSGILGLLFLGLSVVAIMKTDPFSSPLCFSLGVISLGLCCFPLIEGRAGIVAKLLGVVGLVGWVLLAFFFCYYLFWTARGMGWYGNQ